MRPDSFGARVGESKARGRRPRRPRLWSGLGFLILLGLVFGCATAPKPRTKRIFTPEEFRTELLSRVPELSDSLADPPFLVLPDDVALAERRVMEAQPGPARVHALIDALSAPPPEGFGLEYDWLASTNAQRTLESGRGNCFSLASVLVGLGRGLGWPIYYAEARARRPKTFDYEHVTFVADHMVVVIAPKTFQMIIDFTGLVDPEFEIKPIDDLTAYAHLINNVAAQRIARLDVDGTDEQWQRALDGFRLAARIQPTLGRAWNNQGIALTRLGRFEEARAAYERALELDTAFRSAERNLTLMETRAAAGTSVLEQPRAP